MLHVPGRSYTNAFIISIFHVPICRLAPAQRVLNVFIPPRKEENWQNAPESGGSITSLCKVPDSVQAAASLHEAQTCRRIIFTQTKSLTLVVIADIVNGQQDWINVVGALHRLAGGSL